MTGVIGAWPLAAGAGDLMDMPDRQVQRCPKGQETG